MKKVALLVSLFCSTLLFAQEIAQWRGENRDGIYNETGLLKKWPADGPKMLWHYDQLGDGHGSVAVTSDKIFISGTENSQGYVFAFDHSGKLIWKNAYGKEWFDSYDGARLTPLVVKDKLYLMSSYGKIVCMKSSDGKILWSKELFTDFDGRNIKWGVTENLAYDGDMLYCTPGGVKHNVIALNRHNGDLIWTSQGKGEKTAYCSPAIIKHKGKKILVTQTESFILGLDYKTGTLLWSHPQPNRYSVHANTPIYHEGQLFIVSGYGQGNVMLKLADDGNSVEELWREKVLDNRIGGLVLLDGIIYGSGDFSKKWGSLNWKTGELIKSDRIFNRSGTTIAADGLLYYYSETGEIGLVNPNNGNYELISKFEVPYGENQHWAHLVIHNKKLYVRHGSSLMVYDISSK